MLWTKLTVLLATLAPRVLGVPATVEPFSFGMRQCATTVVPDEIAFDTDGTVSTFADGNANVNIYAHVITTQAKKGRYSRDQIQRQVKVMNDDYGRYGIHYALQSVDFTVNNDAASGRAGKIFPVQKRLRKGGYRALNLYFVSELYDDLLGYCPFPTANAPPGSDTFIRDGCIILADSLPGGSAAPYNLGGTASHETGHWFGLLHVFQDNDCASRGDLVADTPRQKNATSGCPQRQDTCPGRPGNDNIHNYMDYSNDSCYTSFTAGQIRRAKSMYSRFRAGK